MVADAKAIFNTLNRFSRLENRLPDEYKDTVSAFKSKLAEMFGNDRKVKAAKLVEYCVDVKVAEDSGMGRMTKPYAMPTEATMLESVVDDLVKSNIDFHLVACDQGIEVWRNGLIEIKE